MSPSLFLLLSMVYLGRFFPLMAAVPNPQPTPSNRAMVAPRHIHHHHGIKYVHRVLSPTHLARLEHIQNREERIMQLGQQQQVLKEKRKRQEPDGRPITYINNLPDETVWPGYASGQQNGGFKLAPGETHTEHVPAGQLDMFRTWIRRDCTEGPDGQLHCKTGDCGGKLVCQGWGAYGSTQLENAYYPPNTPGKTEGSFVDVSEVEGTTDLPLSITVDGCQTISCDPSGVSCPEDMQVKDDNGKLLACSCGYADWNNLQASCPDHGGMPFQNAVKAACPDVYSYAQDDSTGQKYCPYTENGGMTINIGHPSSNQGTALPAPAAVPAVQQVIGTKVQDQTTSSHHETPQPVSTTTSSSGAAIDYSKWWGPGVPGFAEWVADLESPHTKRKE